MSDTNYAFAVARIRVLEKYLLSDSDIEEMTALPDEAAVIAYLKERGWGEEGAKETAEELFTAEAAKTNALMRELKLEPEVLEVFTYQDIYHNLKAAIKIALTEGEAPGVFLDTERYGREEMLRIVSEKDYDALPQHMRAAAEEAYQALLHTRDGQLCDVICDKAALSAIAEARRAPTKDEATSLERTVGYFLDSMVSPPNFLTASSTR